MNYTDILSYVFIIQPSTQNIAQSDIKSCDLRLDEYIMQIKKHLNLN